MKKTSAHPEPDALRVLILEDNPADAELIERQLRRAGIAFASCLVEGKSGFNKALDEFKPQVILSDFKLPKFDGLAALEISCLKAPDTPFLFVSGSIGEEKAIETLALGASDYIFKDNLARLGPAVKRVVAEARLRQEKKKIDEELRRHVEELRLISEASDRFVHINDPDKINDYLSKVIGKISGADYLLLSLYDEKLQAVRPTILTGFEPFRETLQRRFGIDPWQMVLYLKDMRPQDFSDFVSRRLLPVRDGLYGLSNRKMSRSLSRVMEKLLSIGSMYTMGFSWENQLFGGVTVFFKKGNALQNASQVEALVNLAAVAIKRLLAERSLGASEQKYRTLVTQSPDGIFIADLQGNFLSVNQAMCAGLGYTEAEFLALKIWDIVPEQYIAIHKERLGAILKGKAKSEAAEYLVTTKNGGSRFIAILSAPYFQGDKLIGFQGIARDITESKKLDIRLRESEEYYRTLVETSPDAIAIIDPGGAISFASQKTLALFAIPDFASIHGMSIMDFVESGDIPRVQSRMREILSGASQPQAMEYRLQRLDHRKFWAEVSSAPLRDNTGKSIGLLLISRDISERKRIEAERLALQEIMLGLAASESLGDFLSNVHRSIAKVIYAENFFVALYNKETALFEEAYSVDQFDTTPSPPASLEKSVSSYIFRTGKPLLLNPAAFDELEARGEVELVGTNSRSWLGVPLKTSRETIGVMVVQDYETEGRYSERDRDFLVSISGQVALVVERKRAETEVLREKAFLEALVETAPQGIAITDNAGRIQRVNGEFVRMFGYEADEAVGRSINDLVAPAEYLEEARAITRATGAGETSFKETIRRRKDGSLLHVSIIGVPILIAGRQVAVYAIYSDISERKRAEEQIRYQAGLLQDVSDAIIATDKNSVISVWNKAAEKIYGWKAAEAIGKNFHDVISPEYRYQSREDVLAKMNREGVWSGEIVHRLRDGRQIPVQSTITLVNDAAGNPAGTVSVNHDISDRMRAEELLRERDRLLKNLSAQVPGMIYTFQRRPDGTYRIPYTSDAIQDIFGVAPGDVTHDAAAIFKAILAEDQPGVVAAIENSARTLKPFQAEYRVQLPGQPVRWMLGLSDPVRLADGGTLWYGFNTDITERKRIEEQVRNSLLEKEVLLQEIHHRVKNNLQIISGLLTLQANQSAGKSLEDVFRESQDRIHTIALIHEKLYRSHNLAEIAFDDYLRALTENLFGSHGIVAGRITASYDMEKILLTIEKAIPLGLIVNELLTNSLKHAFPGGRRGEIRIRLHGYGEAKSFALKTDSGTLHVVPTCELVVSDDGIGLPAGFSLAEQKTLGMNLVSMLAKQLQAEIRVKPGPGAEFRLIFTGLPAGIKARDERQPGGA